jgi:hypothetical protein
MADAVSLCRGRPLAPFAGVHAARSEASFEPHRPITGHRARESRVKIFCEILNDQKQEQQTFCRICALSVRKRENPLFAAL